jgi:hypothetical protein
MKRLMLGRLCLQITQRAGGSRVGRICTRFSFWAYTRAWFRNERYNFCIAEYLWKHPCICSNVALFSCPTHSSFNFDQRSEYLLIFLATPNNLQAHRSIRKRLWRIQAVDPGVLRILWCIVDVRDINIGINSGYWKHDTGVVQEIPMSCYRKSQLITSFIKCVRRATAILTCVAPVA